MACTIKRDENGIISVLAENGNKSLLYQSILKLPFTKSEEDALNYYQAALKYKGSDYLVDINNEPILMFASLSASNTLALPNKTVLTSSYTEALAQDKEQKGIEVGFLKKSKPLDLGQISDNNFFSKMRNISARTNGQVIGHNESGTILVSDPSTNNFKPITKVNPQAIDNTLGGFIQNLVSSNLIKAEKIPATNLQQEESTVVFKVFDMGNNDISVMAIEEGRKIGVLRLIKKGDIIQVREVRVDKGNRKKGIGRELYFTAREELGQDIYSDAFHSPEVIMLWESLVRDGFAEKIGPKTTPVTKRTEEVSKGVEAVRKIAAEYKKLNKIKGTAPLVVTALETTVSEEMAREYELVEDRPNNPEVKKSYAALIAETIAQYDFIVGKGLQVEKYLGKGEPYQDSKEMLEDLRTNNTLKFLPNDEAFGEGAEIYKDSIGLQPSGRFLADGYQLTNSEVFRIVHDYFGHGILGNQFGAIGEENATLQHLDLYSDEAKPAVVFQTRGQNSWVNFSGENKEVFSMFAEAKKLKNEGKSEEAKKVLDKAREAFKFAKPKEGIFKNKYNFKKYDTARRIREQEQIERANDARTNESNDLRNSLPIISKNNVTTRGINRRNRQGNTKIQSHVLKNVTEVSLSSEAQEAIKKAFPKITTFPKIFEIKDGAVYRDLQIKGLEGVPMSSSVTIHSTEEYNTMRMFVTEDGYTGITITKDGHLGGAFSSEKSGRSADLAQLMVIGVKEGATNAEAFDTFLPDYYTKFGFKAVSTVAFNEEVAEGNGWNYEEYKGYNNGKPDIVHFIYDGGDRATIEERLDQFDTYSDYQKEEVKKFDKNSYDESYKYMEVEVVKRYNFEKEQNRTGYKLTSVPSDIKFQTSTVEEVVQEEVIDEVIGRLKSAGLTSNIFQLSQEEITQKLEQLGSTPVNSISKGFIVTENGQKNVYLNKDTMTLDTPLHEVAGHAMLDFVKVKARNIYDRGMTLVSQELRKENSSIQDVIDYVRTTQPTLTGEALNNEILAEYIGRVGSELIQNQKNPALTKWLSDLWNFVKKSLGIFDKNFDLNNATIRDFAEAMSISTLRGDNVAEQAQNYFGRVADRLPLTLAVFNTKPFQDLIGKQVNPVTIQQLLNQSGIKQIEKDLINQIITDNYTGQKKIDYNELEATVRANIMPLERVITSSYANYGMKNLGDGNYGDANTLILNAPIEHGITGHFSDAFKASGRKNIKYIPKQLNDNTWVAVEEGYESQANNNNIYQFVGTAGTKEAVDNWINNYDGIKYIKIEEGVKVRYEDSRGVMRDATVVSISDNNVKVINIVDGEFYEADISNFRPIGLDAVQEINKGMFGHIRVWQDNTDFYVAELQSDYFQKYNARKEFLENNEEFKEINKEYNTQKEEIQVDKLNYKRLKATEDALAIIESNSRVKIQPYKLELYDGTLDEEYLWIFVDGNPIIKGRVATSTGYSTDYQRDYLIKDRNLESLFELLGEDFQVSFNKQMQKNLDNFDLQGKLLEKEYNKKVEALLSELPLQQKQFIASQKEWEKRMVREAIKEAALSGAETLRFPTPYTLSVIEGYIEGANGSAVELVGTNEIGQDVYYLGELYTIMNTYYDDSIDIAPANQVDSVDLDTYIESEQEFRVGDYLYEITVGNTYSYKEVKNLFSEAQLYLENELESIAEEQGIEVDEAKLTLTQGMVDDITEDIKRSIKENIDYSPENYFTDMGYDNVVLFNNTIYYTRGSVSLENVSTATNLSDKDDFTIESLDNTQQTVARKYEEIAAILTKERGEDNVEIITDDNGFDWYETKILSSETQNPVIAFQKSIDQVVSEMIRSGEISANCKL